MEDDKISCDCYNYSLDSYKEFLEYRKNIILLIKKLIINSPDFFIEFGNSYISLTPDTSDIYSFGKSSENDTYINKDKIIINPVKNITPWMRRLEINILFDFIIPRSIDKIELNSDLNLIKKLLDLGDRYSRNISLYYSKDLLIISKINSWSIENSLSNPFRLSYKIVTKYEQQ